MSGGGSLTLDHVALITPDLKAAKEAYQKLGFQLTRESSHKGRLSPEGPVELWGSGNHCAMFRQGYYEILGITDRSRPHERFRALAERFHGVSIVALGCERAEELYRSRKERVSGLKPPVEIGRDVPHGRDGAETRPALFRVVGVSSDAFPAAELLFVEHQTPELLWQKGLLDHPNGATALAGVTICSDDPDETAERFEEVTLREREDRAPRFSLDEGFVEMQSPDEIAERYEGAVLPAVPCVAVVRFSVSDLEATRAYLEGQKITAHGGGKRIWVRPERAGGVVLEFE
jgi:catechol 2,3-dioxygenase-like lactoylglutathione lyase family enzyme